MPDRATAISSFLSDAGWGGATHTPLAGDASNRRYLRLGLNGAQAVLMDAPPGTGENTRPFIAVARHLTALGLSAPRILAQDEVQGLLLLEDLGDGLYARLIEQDPSCEHELYSAAVDVLLSLHAHPVPNWVPDYGPQAMTEATGLAWGWYAKGMTGTADGRDVALRELGTLLEKTATEPVLVLRDYHAENLLWLPERTGIARVGQLDFQDAVAGHPAYDLISLTEDARRDVSPELAQDMTNLYIARSGWNADQFHLAAAVCAAQRNLRILGVFARLLMHFGKPGYVDLIPRVWDHLQRDLAHPGLATLREACASLPEPTHENLQTLSEKCGTIPTL